MSPTKDVNRVTKSPSKKKATQSSASSDPSTPNKQGYGPVDDADLLWAVLYKAADDPKPNYQRAAELLGMPYTTLFGRFARIKKLHDGTPVVTPTSKQRKAHKSKEALKSEIDVLRIKDEDKTKSEVKNEVMVKVEVEVEANGEKMDEDEA
ncbi:hypothetical protein N7448_009356 [Penicillium atrosanguineum]|uniref:HTH psq-type domain-containing protein n=1 Tax=Penicillium atrosanguineum TaxID=1132637 RepID=A0A9W9U6E6_9EURO|nr:uncharacterized protein N7443_006606 [Penicillium atrosanguineum]KAJ5123259.1 hypothetical protein N7448_009356 [Penicillium atrosanguineum]KAJ5141889.1 hypothetical protein N7526_002884 [Penicillium atrosanguineum]KAJ5298486.1 hypothetical protein N7443_006606 [Penicillium atrosanguineum]KAJ5321248.1 hypothetical protein N7476_004250 [Penicillium atrosanguineum]